MDDIVKVSWVPGIEAYRLTITRTNPDPAYCVVDRVDVTGVHAVRFAETPGYGTTLVDDFEAPLLGEVAYRWSIDAHMDTTPAPARTGELLPMIHHVTDPARRFICESITRWDENFSWGTTISEIVDGEYPRTVTGSLTSRGVTFTAVMASYGEASTLRQALATHGTYLLRQPDHVGLDCFFVPLSGRVTAQEIQGRATVWGVEIQGREVARPTGAMRSTIGRAYRDDLAAAPSYAASYAARPKYTNRQQMK